MLTQQAADDCRAEIEDLHRFFVDWFRAAVPADDPTWLRLDEALAPSFEMITPDGVVERREPLLARLRELHGSQDEGFAIWIEAYDCRLVDERIIVATYEEWQRRAGVVRGRLSTVVFERYPLAPYRVRWLHVHETWLAAGRAPARPAP